MAVKARCPLSGTPRRRSWVAWMPSIEKMQEQALAKLRAEFARRGLL